MSVKRFAAFLVLAAGCSSAPRPAELKALDGAMSDKAALEAAAEAAPEEVARAKAEYAQSREAFEDGDIEDSIHYAELSDLSLKLAMEKLRVERANTQISDAKRSKTDAAARLVDAVDAKGKLERRIARMEKILALESSLETEKSASRAQKRSLEAKLDEAKKAQEEALKKERTRQELVELVATVRAKLETAEVMKAGDHAPEELKGAQDTLALAQRAIVGDQFADARKLVASADQSATKAIEVARREFKAKNARLGQLEERNEILAKATAIVETSAIQERGVVVTLYGMFAAGESEVRGEKIPVLERLSSLAKEYSGYPILVEGYTDSQGREKTNLELSEARASSVLNLLFAKGIETGRARAAGYGEARPVADNSTAEGRAKNRRVELVLLFP
ncbi:MAG: OmpA family protein [Myxococcota bacterium]